MGILFLAVATVCAAGCSNKAASAATGPSHAAELRPIVALGDSLTSGYGLARDEAYRRCWRKCCVPQATR